MARSLRPVLFSGTAAPCATARRLLTMFGRVRLRAGAFRRRGASTFVRRPLPVLIAVFVLTAAVATPAFATMFGVVRGTVVDQQDRPVQGATVLLDATSSSVTRQTTTDATGSFRFAAVTLGDYLVTITDPGFAAETVDATVSSGTATIVRVRLRVASRKETVTVAGSPAAPTESSTPITLVSRNDILRTPGADTTNSLAMITDYVPGSYFTHDMLHIRGGHQTLWLLDGVPMINTAIAATVGPQLDPEDIQYLEANRGSYGAEFGDRTYGVFNVVPRSGFDENNQGELTVTGGNFYQTDDHFSMGGHTQRFAYYTSGSVNRSDLGLQPPVPQIVHDAENGYGGFGSFIFNKDPANQIRLVVTALKDNYQIPYDPDPNDIENGSIAANGFSPQWQSIGLRDKEEETDSGALMSWTHTFNANALVTVSPFYHYNSGNYTPSASDTPVATTQNRSSAYTGAQASFSFQTSRNTLEAGVFTLYERDSQFFGATFNDGSGTPPIADTQQPTANLETFFAQDDFQPFSWLTLNAGMRPTRFSGNSFSESSVSPRVGAAATLPRLNWTFRAFWGRYYQEPPLESVSGPALVDFAAGQGLAFIPLHGEFDEERQFGVNIPIQAWTIDIDTFRTDVRNFLDHNNIGDSSIFFPITVSQALIRGWEATVRSPRFENRLQVHLAYSNQIAEGSGTITGGLTDFTVFPELSPLDHDQRNTLNVGGDVSLPWDSYAATNIYYGSGFSNGFPDQPYPGDYLPAHTTVDLSLGKSFAKRYDVSFEMLNVGNERVELDNSLTFGGFHWNNPREYYVRVRYKFHY
jgi:outer membrane receptor for ferrienterochelin and colicin